jgi:hypothetical protein
MKIKEVYDIINAELGGPLAADGYKKKAAKGRPLWVKPHGKRFQMIHFFGDKYPYERLLGGKFGMKAALGDGPKMTDDDWNNASCLMDMLDDEGLRQLTTVRDSIINKILAQEKTGLTEDDKVLLGPFFRFLRDDLRKPFREGFEEYLPYLDRTDVEEWCHCIGKMLPAIEAFLRNSGESGGEVRVRR